MNTRKAAGPHPEIATRKDLLLVQTGPSVAVADPVAELEALGYTVEQRGQDHWLVTGFTPLPELHFYHRAELARFLHDRARRYYQKPLTKRTSRHAFTADLPD